MASIEFATRLRMGIGKNGRSSRLVLQRARAFFLMERAQEQIRDFYAGEPTPLFYASRSSATGVSSQEIVINNPQASS